MQRNENATKKQPPITGTDSRATDYAPWTLAERLLTANEVAGMLHISRSGVYQLVRRGDLPSIKIGSALRFRGQDVREFMQRHFGPAPRLRVRRTFEPPRQHSQHGRD